MPPKKKSRLSELRSIRLLKANHQSLQRNENILEDPPEVKPNVSELQQLTLGTNRSKKQKKNRKNDENVPIKNFNEVPDLQAASFVKMENINEEYSPSETGYELPMAEVDGTSSLRNFRKKTNDVITPPSRPVLDQNGPIETEESSLPEPDLGFLNISRRYDTNVSGKESEIMICNLTSSAGANVTFIPEINSIDTIKTIESSKNNPTVVLHDILQKSNTSTRNILRNFRLNEDETDNHSDVENQENPAVMDYEDETMESNVVDIKSEPEDSDDDPLFIEEFSESEDMPRHCSECNFKLKSIDPHTSCVFHSKCLKIPYFDPRDCEACLELFEICKISEEARSCWQNRMKRLTKHSEKVILHPKATAFDINGDQFESSFNTPAIAEAEGLLSEKEISYQAMKLLEKLTSNLQEKNRIENGHEQDSPSAYSDSESDMSVSDVLEHEENLNQEFRDVPEPEILIGEVYILPEDAEIHSTRVVLQGCEISSIGKERMVDSFQQHRKNKIRILRYCPAVLNFLVKLAAYGSQIPARKSSICQEIRAPFNKTTMEMTSWKLEHDHIEVSKIPDSLTTLASDIENQKPCSSFSSTLPLVSSTIPLLSFASAPKLSESCHKLSKNLAALTLKPPKKLLKQDYETRLELLQHLRLYLSTSTTCTLLNSVKQIASLEKSSQAEAVFLEIENIRNFLEKGTTASALSLLIPILKKAAHIRRKIRSYVTQGLGPVQVRLALLEGSLFQGDLFDKVAVAKASKLAQPCSSGPLQQAYLINNKPSTRSLTKNVQESFRNKKINRTSRNGKSFQTESVPARERRHHNYLHKGRSTNKTGISNKKQDTQ